MLGFLTKRHARRIGELQEELETVKRQVRSLTIEWESTYNKLRAIVARLNKRDDRAAADLELPDADPGRTAAPQRPSEAHQPLRQPHPVRRMRGF